MEYKENYTLVIVAERDGAVSQYGGWAQNSTAPQRFRLLCPLTSIFLNTQRRIFDAPETLFAAQRLPEIFPNIDTHDEYESF